MYSQEVKLEISNMHLVIFTFIARRYYKMIQKCSQQSSSVFPSDLYFQFRQSPSLSSFTPFKLRQLFKVLVNFSCVPVFSCVISIY